MSINIDTSINWFKSKIGKVTYSMTGARDGSDGTGDCSGMVVTALVNGGAKKPSWLLNTEYMHDWLIENGFELIAFNKSWDMKKGDVGILGLKGQSSGAGGHTFLAIDGTNAIDCAWYGSSTVNAVRIRNENVQPYDMGFYIYRLKKINNSKPIIYQNKQGWYEALRDDTFYCEKELKRRSRWNIKKGNVIYVDGIEKIGKYTRARMDSGPHTRYCTLRDDFWKYLGK